MPYPYSVDDYVLEIENVLDEIGEENVDILAHSFGARVAIKLANKDKRIDKIVFTGGAGLKPKRTLKYYYKVYFYKLLKKIKPNSKRLANFGSAEYKTLSPIYKDSYTKIVNEHLDYTLKEINNKVLIINGKLDTTTPKYMAKKMKRRIKNSELVFLQGAGHFAFIDKPTIFNIIVKEFLLF